VTQTASIWTGGSGKAFKIVSDGWA
jgi:hypothetical protein